MLDARVGAAAMDALGHSPPVNMQPVSEGAEGGVGDGSLLVPLVKVSEGLGNPGLSLDADNNSVVNIVANISAAGRHLGKADRAREEKKEKRRRQQRKRERSS